MGRKVTNLYYGLAVTALVVVSVVAAFVMMAGQNEAQTISEHSMVENDGARQTTVDSVNRVPLKEEVDEIDDERPMSNEVPAEKSDPGVSPVAENPLTQALKSKRPVLADFGRGTCIPCKMMQPILEKLQKEYTGKAEILILDVSEHPAFSKEYHLMVIPTQIFFDSSGKEVNRHLGFMPEEEIVAQLKAMGVEK